MSESRRTPLLGGRAVQDVRSSSSDNCVRSGFEAKSKPSGIVLGGTVFIVPLTEGDSLDAKRQAGGQAGRNVSSRAQAGRNMARARPPARALLALSPFARGTVPHPMFCR